MVKYLVFPALLAVVLLAAYAGYLNYHNSQIEAFLNVETSESKKAEQLKDASAIPTRPEPMMIMLDSYPPGFEYPLEDWKVLDQTSGYIDGAAINKKPFIPNGTVTLHSSDILELNGWAGHWRLGMRFPEVLFSSCGIVFAGTSVSNVRSDIAETVHPNLMHSGWSARLYVDDIPRCDKAMISAWGRPPAGSALRPLIGGVKFTYNDKPRKNKPSGKLNLVHEGPQSSPDTVMDAVPVQLEIRAEIAKLHRCASPKCKVVATLPPGPVSAVLIEDIDGWYLLQSDKGSGWVLSTVVEVLDK
ncbi:MAG: hypothetical protein HON65_00945 [Rhodospirillales bacterium]|nr:hypothetical protein [Rhodospirillales bacterium]